MVFVRKGGIVLRKLDSKFRYFWFFATERGIVLHKLAFKISIFLFTAAARVALEKKILPIYCLNTFKRKK